MNTDHYKALLVAQEQALLVKLERAGVNLRDLESEERIGDAGDESIGSERKEEQLREADLDWKLLNDVRQALRRIDEGTYGQCLVDGGPIEEKRLEAMPWTPYCLKHQQQMEGPEATRSATM